MPAPLGPRTTQRWSSVTCQSRRSTIGRPPRRTVTSRKLSTSTTRPPYPRTTGAPGCVVPYPPAGECRADDRHRRVAGIVAARCRRVRRPARGDGARGSGRSRGGQRAGCRAQPAARPPARRPGVRRATAPGCSSRARAARSDGRRARSGRPSRRCCSAVGTSVSGCCAMRPPGGGGTTPASATLSGAAGRDAHGALRCPGAGRGGHRGRRTSRAPRPGPGSLAVGPPGLGGRPGSPPAGPRSPGGGAARPAGSPARRPGPRAGRGRCGRDRRRGPRPGGRRCRTSWGRSRT